MNYDALHSTKDALKRNKRFFNNKKLSFFDKFQNNIWNLQSLETGTHHGSFQSQGKPQFIILS